MTLFEECKEALSANFNIVEGKLKQDAIDILYSYPFEHGNIAWSKMEYSDYDGADELLNASLIRNVNVFVFADDDSIPIFRTNLNLVAENIYDVTALSPKIFIYNDKVILQPRFPTDIFRIGNKK
ncbi:hypothetical protein [Erwinia amylovora]|uniref:CDI toxin immunity protein n=1 Tax=Erwinia amylovora TaxID=552 RepID=UPI001444183D|nr:hypothetical protein [Erwinia amylovora]